ncbi:MAG: ATP-dependent DNA helicase RecG [Aureliella sp.]
MTKSVSMEESAGPTVSLRTPVQLLDGVGVERAGLLARLRIRTAAELLFHFPRSYDQATPLLAYSDFDAGAKAAFIAAVDSFDERWTQSGKHLLGVLVHVEEASSEGDEVPRPVRLVFFNQAFRKNMLQPNRRVLVRGVVKANGLSWEMVQPQVQILQAGEQPETEHPAPIYPLTEGLKQYSLRKMMRTALPAVIPLVTEVLPESLRETLAVPDIAQALHWLHFPESPDEAEAAMRRFKLQELLVLQLALRMQRVERERVAVAPECEPTGKIHSRILSRIQFSLTSDQERAIAEIGADMSRSVPMNRLLQGDVGSGKTVVAQYAMMLCAAYRYQAALMAPTEILAQQHAHTLRGSLGSSRVNIELVTGSQKAAERRRVLEGVESGEVDLLVGTQALLADQLQFANLGLVIVDEQHKFGVLQRAKLRVDGEQPHYLVLSATPIPRTIAMTDFGDLDVSTIREKPPGRASVHSYTATTDDLDSWWKFVDGKIDEGRQAFVIAPRVSHQGERSDEHAMGDSEKGLPPGASGDRNTAFEEPSSKAIATAVGTYQVLSEKVFAHRRIALLHGQMDPAEKLAAMEAFAAHEVDILVSTTVVEVGINVPNATVMTILDANRLGLSQLHQLRGRVARGSQPGYVCAVATEGSEAKDHERLKAFEKTDDGFELAELDLKMRGPGDLLGTSQSGLPPFRVANLARDTELVEIAREQAKVLLEEDPDLANPAFQRLRKQTVHRYGPLMQLGDIG